MDREPTIPVTHGGTMLVLTRKEGEAVVIPRALIRVTVTRVDGNRVRLGFETPHGCDVFREELLERGYEPPSMRKDASNDR